MCIIIYIVYHMCVIFSNSCFLCMNSRLLVAALWRTNRYNEIVNPLTVVCVLTC